MKTAKIRESFFEFFRSKDHYILPSHSLIPDNDNTLLWINCGMAPLKKFYAKQAIPPSPRMANSQKSLRTNDIDNVGKTDRHHTMFEMLGNFSIGDYFKSEAIAWAWEFLTEVIKIDKNRLHVTIHPEDDEAFNIWTKEIGLDPSHIVRDKENFWEIGPGPCGPNTELYFDRGEEHGCKSKECQPGCDDCQRFLEVWNLVFTQFNREVDGSLTELPYKNIDTGMSLERLASVVQNVESNYDIDLFKPILNKIESISNCEYNEKTKVAMRIIADHIRSITFAIADGAMPSNEGRGYIIRRLLRRAVRYGKKLNLSEPFLFKIVNSVVEAMKDHYTYLYEKQSFIKRIVLSEEERFFNTLEEGEKLLSEVISKVKSSNQSIIKGVDAFKLYDTYGFPLELTAEIASEADCQVDIDGFNEAMQQQRERARKARKGDAGNIVAEQIFSNITAGFQFVGYDKVNIQTEIIAIQGVEDKATNNSDKIVEFLLQQTPFYAESGGQVSDKGAIYSSNGKINVIDVQKLPDGRILHSGIVEEGSITQGEVVNAVVDQCYRQAIKVHHTSTHLVHQALKNILGDHVNQAGSLVRADRLRFDFTHFSGLTDEEIEQIQSEVNQLIFQSVPVIVEEMNVKDAMSSGATALFGEKYGDTVRVVSVGDYSKELCGGTHLNSTAEAGMLIIISEGSVGSGIRRIEAVAGQAAYQYINNKLGIIAQASELLKVSEPDMLKRIQDLQSENHSLYKKNHELNQKMMLASLDNFLNKTVVVNGIPIIAVEVDVDDMDGLRQVADALKAKQPNGVIILGSRSENKVSLLAMIDDKLVKEHKLHAGKIIKKLSQICGGGGGGRPQMAQAGGKKPEALPEALALVPTILQEHFQ